MALHFLIVPRIGDLRPWLEQQASHELGVSVRIGAIEARSNGLIPSFDIRDVVLLDAQGREALRVPSVLAALSARSLLSLGFEQLHVEGLVLEVRRAADGQIWVAGFALPQQQSTDSARADWLFKQTELAIRHGTLHWTDESRNEPTLTLTDVDMVLRNRHRQQRVATAQLQPQRQPAQQPGDRRISERAVQSLLQRGGLGGHFSPV